MKLFFVSDLHGSLPATETVLEKYQASRSDFLIILGDVLNHGPRNPVPDGYQPAEVARLLNTYKDEIIAVRGNCDSEVDQMLLDFPMMESYAWVILESGARIFLTHGHHYNSDNRPALKVGDVIAHGHSHIPVAKRIGEQFIYNPGSITFPKGGYVASYGLYENGVFNVLSFTDTVLKSVTIAN
ncbi:phosphodiesterase [Vibrio sp. TH_r3]|uniref:phosphodiesterase n=1 Tax=Vibrio sp. TH_r3 TaxID=3082084 RepID=UPI002955DE15|nr:phosphodiesterase [Vibrio sp. TH_r3]MDV7103246.1 phosphodiesterase [Vibrio sp. TH_r3]